MQKLKRAAKRVLIAAGILAALILTAAAALRFVYYRSFFCSAEAEFPLPALEDGFVPQGVEYIEDKELFLVSGYVYNSGQAEVCVVLPDGGFRAVKIGDENGNTLVCHCGGICESGGFVYISGCNGICYVLRTSELLDESADCAGVLGGFNTFSNADFCCAYDGELYVGEYHYGVKYSTDKFHRVKTPSGEKNTAISAVFRLDPALPLGVGTTPVKAVSIPSRVQGMCVTESFAALSASSVFRGSQLYIYSKSALTGETDARILIGGFDVPLYFLDGGSLEKTVELLPKAEGATLYNNRLLTVYESASARFLYGWLLGAQYAYSLPAD